MKRVCKQCGKTIRSNNRKAIYLFLQLIKSREVEQWVCNKHCLQEYNHGSEAMDEAGT
jgi:hypothetical protein